MNIHFKTQAALNWEDIYTFQNRGGWGCYETELFKGEVIFASDKIQYTFQNTGGLKSGLLFTPFCFLKRGSWGGYETELFKGEIILASKQIESTFQDTASLIFRRFWHL